MGLFGNNLNKDMNGFVINLRQKEPFNENYLVGLLPEDGVENGRFDRMSYKFHPAGAKTSEESRKLVPSKPKNNLVFTFPAGAIDPQPVHILLPDNYANMPRPLIEAQFDSVPSLGAVLNKMLYVNQGVVEMLKVNAREHPERIEEMRETYMQSDLTSEKKLDDVAKIVNTVLENTDKGRNQ